MNPIEVTHLTKHYPGFSLDDVTFSVPQGYVTGFVGANGSGKTTTIKAVLGMALPDSGTAACLPHERVGVVFDTVPYHAEWRVRDVERALAPFYPTWDPEVFAREVAAARLHPQRKVKELSRGMGTRLQVAAALAHDPDLLILDEPTAGLDPLARTEVADALAQYMTTSSHTVLFSTHITTDLERLADYLVVLNQGRVAASGTTQDVLASFRVVRGTPEHLTGAVRQASLGVRSTQLGWEALMPTSQAQALADRAVVETPSIEELAVYIAKEGDSRG